jgi:hypothetical protein
MRYEEFLMKNKIINFIFKHIFLLVFTVFITGCNTESFKDRAADKARDYIFENYPRMSPQNANYIKYTYPKFLTSRISSTLSASDPSAYYWNYGNNYFNQPQFSKSKDFSQVAIAWELPSPNATIMVLGTCYDNYWSWEPLRLVIRERNDTDTSQIKNIKTDTEKGLDKPTSFDTAPVSSS